MTKWTRWRGALGDRVQAVRVEDPVVVIEPAETLNRESATPCSRPSRSLPHGSVIVLINHRAEAAAPHLVSRCHREPVRPAGRVPGRGRMAADSDPTVQPAAHLRAPWAGYPGTRPGHLLEARSGILQLPQGGDPVQTSPTGTSPRAEPQPQVPSRSSLVLVESILEGPSSASANGGRPCSTPNAAEVTLRSGKGHAGRHGRARTVLIGRHPGRRGDLREHQPCAIAATELCFRRLKPALGQSTRDWVLGSLAFPPATPVGAGHNEVKALVKEISRKPPPHAPKCHVVYLSRS
ncbi:MAG: hypothetical protein MZU79_09150 [Anaerotruncus sp.]|nr:hypothetical protein [Anaerotruncus sp.]